MNWIKADWPVPATVHAGTTTREGGVSEAPYDSLNLSTAVLDDEEAVAQNRAILKEELRLPSEPFWLNQSHSTRVVDLSSGNKDADAAYTNQPSRVCVAMTADCLPVLLCSQDGKEVAAVHAGWRGLADGVIEQAVKQFRAPSEQLFAWLGPAIGPSAFEVDHQVRDIFLAHDDNAQDAFTKMDDDKWLADLYFLAKRRLDQLGVDGVFGGDYCTYSEEASFFSYRRENITGRMASLIWFD